ncbi:hypothetical protein DNHGIG_31620 [Collibacillus ludicampi]|uniref:Uncharacterized protein n=1 Tax=Collibacillus ludicampi TaxID=2771369 RepID=A0AAV4LIN3_9BACL|nr:hypothetical protein DNHGIG_31620 [Collibacillus ludicampi]
MATVRGEKRRKKRLRQRKRRRGNVEIQIFQPSFRERDDPRPGWLVAVGEWIPNKRKSKERSGK